jgi:hypothetical protein
MKIIKYLPIFFITLIFISCGDDICTSDTESLINAEIIVVDTNLINGKYLDSLSFYSPEWPDSIHYWEDGSENSFFFMLSPNDTSTTIILSSKHEVLKDTIQIFHQNELFFLSECGFILNYKINSLSFITDTTNLIDSIYLVQDEITNDENGHVKIYL